MEQIVCPTENNVSRALLVDKEVQCKNCYRVAMFGLLQEAGC
jgi:hypothetical protein